MPPPPATKKTSELSPEAIGLLIEQQARETEVRKLEVDLRLQELKHNSAHAEKILGAQERDREAERQHERTRELHRLVFATICILLLIVMVVAGMYLNKDALVGDILKVLGGVIAGALGGYGYSKVEAKSKDDPE